MTINVKSGKIYPILEFHTTEIVKIQKQSSDTLYFKYLQLREKLATLFWVGIGFLLGHLYIL